jgi:hypothetical protein
MFVNVVNKHVLFYFILFFGLLAQWEGETNNCDCWPSKNIPLKIMRVTMKRTREGRCKEKEGRTIAEIEARRGQPT